MCILKLHVWFFTGIGFILCIFNIEPVKNKWRFCKSPFQNTPRLFLRVAFGATIHCLLLQGFAANLTHLEGILLPTASSLFRFQEGLDVKLLCPWKLPHSCFTRKESKEVALYLCPVSLSQRQRVSGVSPFSTLENTCEASKPQDVAQSQPSGCGLLQISFIHILVLNTASLSPSPGFICCHP